jgi:predicted permease
MDAAGEHPPEEQGYSRWMMVAAGLLTILMPGGALIVALAMFLAVRENQRKRTQLKKWLLVNVAVLVFIVFYILLHVVLSNGDYP